MEHWRTGKTLRKILSIPFIWGVLPAFLILDLALSLYHAICFPLYGMAKVQRAQHIRIDRHTLGYLSFRDKLNCAYCGYANGLLSYSVAIVGKTEQYWCGIQHRQGGGFKPPAHHAAFIRFGDRTEYEKARTFKK